MSYRQLVLPNFSISEKAGLCLSFARRVFNAPIVEDTATQAWNADGEQHKDRNFPDGVAVPIFFSWYGNILWSDGVWRKDWYGHAAVRAADGRIHSSPLTGVGSSIFNSVDELTKAFGGGMVYVGWREDISKVKVVEEEEMELFNEGDRKNKNTSLYAGEDRGKFKFAIGMPYKDADYAIMKSDEYKEDASINTGDAVNLSDKLGTDMKPFIGKTWKAFGYAMPSRKPAEYEEVTEKLYRKK